MVDDEGKKPRGGWIKLYRCIQDNPFWRDEPFTRGQAWIDLLLIANHQDGIIRRRGIKVFVKRGEVAWSYRALADRWRWSIGKVQRFVNELKGDEQIHFRTDTEKVSVTTLIVITNFEKYQSCDTETDTETGTEQEVKEVKKESKPSSCPKPKSPVSPDALRLSEMLAGMILKNNPRHTKLSNGSRVKTVVSWAKDIDKLLHIDKQTPEAVESIISQCQRDEFWRANILSGAKLREKWDTLVVKFSTVSQSSPPPSQERPLQVAL